MLSKHLIGFYQKNHFVVTGNLTEISHDESLVTPPSGGSSINWLVGHIVRYRAKTLAYLGHPLANEAQLKELYDFNTIPNSETAMPLEELKALYESSQKQIVDLMVSIDEGLETEDKLVFMAYHETMHSGQLGILRRMLGKNPGVKYG